MSTARPSPEEIVAGVENTGKDILPRVHFGLFFLLDLAYYTALIWRPYGEQPYQMTVIHYIGFLLSSDPLAYFLSDRRAHWWNVFRFVDSVQSVQATVALWLMGVDGGVFCGELGERDFVGVGRVTGSGRSTRGEARDEAPLLGD